VTAPRVAVNLTWMTPGRVGGSEEYLTRQLCGIAPSEFDIDIYSDRRFAESHPDLAARFRTTPMPAIGDRRAMRIALEHSWLAVVARGADLVHHGGGTAPAIGSRPFLLTIHDLQYLRYPRYFSRARRRYLSAVVPRSARRAAVIAVPSGFVHSDVVEALGVGSDRVVVVPHGVPATTRPDAELIAAARGRASVGDRPFVIYPAITHPHKGHVVLVDMLRHLGDDTAVVLIGGEGSAEADLRRSIAASPHGARVVRAGRVSADDRDALIAGADALVFPSEFEGFGAPVVEAMALGTPVVCSAADALVEVVGDAAVIVATNDGGAWADGVIAARAQRDDLVARGHRRREAFTIEASGRALAAAYHRVVAS
jgi:glycosyltransferase involved in cell wall biosynthesis